MSILDNVKALVEPLVFKKDGSVSCGFGVRIQMSVILDRENWIKIEDGIKTIEAELTRLRDENERMREALKEADEFIRNGIEYGYIQLPGPGVADRANDTPGIVRAALSRAEQAKMEVEK